MSEFTDLRGLPIPNASSSLKEQVEVPFQYFGKGSAHPFEWYFQGESAVRVGTLEHICDWLIECEYLEDRKLFQEDDFWQHPVTFEYLRKGDCADHALWAWRKLCQIGIESEFVSGRLRSQGEGEGHAWLIFREEAHLPWQVMETTSKRRSKMILSLSDAAISHLPRFSVDRTFKTFRYSTQHIF